MELYQKNFEWKFWEDREKKRRNEERGLKKKERLCTFGIRLKKLKNTKALLDGK